MTEKKPDESIKDSKVTETTTDVCTGHETPEKTEVKTEVKTEQEIPKYIQDFNTKLDAIQTNYSNLAGQLEKLKSLETQIGARVETPVSKTNDEPFSLAKTMEKVKRWIEGDRDQACTVTIPVDVLRGTHIQKVKTPHGVMETFKSSYAQEQKVREALGYTGTQSVWDLDTDVALEPGGFSFVPVTQFAKYKEIARGTDRASFFKHDLPAPATQTPGTTATIGTMDIESIQVTPSTVTGVHLEIDTDDIENNPYDTVGVVVKASAARFEDFIATDMLDTVSAQGTLTPGKWIRADTGATITHSDIASIAFDPTGIATAVEFLEDQGYLRGGQQPVCFLDPEQFKELAEDSELTNWIAFSNPNVYTKYQMAELYGCRLVRTNAIEHKDNTTTDSHNAIMCIPQHSYGVASARNVQVKFHEVPEDNQIWATTSWRIKSGVIDANSIVRLTSVNN